ncbi:MAG TPA: hypothetical protein VF622_00190 [Segetibacter sp.]|jgi:hypothetical protein
MIQKEELRLGNWVEFTWDGGYDRTQVCVTGIFHDGVEVVGNIVANPKAAWSDLDPIYLCSEDMIYAGFEEKEKELLILDDWKIDLKAHTARWKNQLIKEDLLHVHQLQNLVYIISGVELKLIEPLEEE